VCALVLYIVKVEEEEEEQNGEAQEGGRKWQDLAVCACVSACVCACIGIMHWERGVIEELWRSYGAPLIRGQK